MSPTPQRFQERHSFPSAYAPTGLIACHECDQVHQLPATIPEAKALCRRCGGLLFRTVRNARARALALNLSAMLLLIMVNSLPFLSLKLSGRLEETLLLSGAWALVEDGQWELGLVVALTSAIFPFLTISAWLYMLVPLNLGYRPPGLGWVFRWTNRLTPWSLIGVFMLGVLVAIVKLADLAEVVPGVGLFAFVILLIVISAARIHQDASVIWPLQGPELPLDNNQATASDLNLRHCHDCGLLVAASEHQCPRCGSHLHDRKPNSLHRTWALMLAAVVLYVPANAYPVMTVIQFGSGEPSTILGGVIYLIHHNMISLALLVLFASVVVPLAKLVVLAYLLISIRRGSTWRPRDRTKLYRVTELIGSWSMVDIYIVAILSGLVKLDALATIEPGIGASFFAAVVILTMFAAHSFDPRLIWDHSGRPIKPSRHGATETPEPRQATKTL